MTFVPCQMCAAFLFLFVLPLYSVFLRGLVGVSQDAVSGWLLTGCFLYVVVHEASLRTCLQVSAGNN